MDEIEKFELEEHLKPMGTCNIPKNSNTMCKKKIAKKTPELSIVPCFITTHEQ
jgi:hypothetical protein